MDFSPHPAGSFLGRHDQRHHDAVGRVEQTAPDDPGPAFLVVSLSFYGMSTFEGPMMSIKTVNALEPLHRLDHRSRALRCAGLVAFISPSVRCTTWSRAWRQDMMYCVEAIELHFWMRRIGIVLYIADVDFAGVMQGA